MKLQVLTINLIVFESSFNCIWHSLSNIWFICWFSNGISEHDLAAGGDSDAGL